jgi:rhamnopyranosyl-N-acetylglucosaminyl-diphospho-decaprenol beta-1,3/1,4-galactofuranosyltransferase
MGKIAAVIPTYNRKQMLQACLRSLADQTHALDAMIVVDNGSTDGTAEMLAAHFPKAHRIHEPTACGSAGGFNKGIALALSLGFEWVWLMDNDAVASKDALHLLVKASESSNGKVFNSLVVTPDGRNINWGYNLYHRDRHEEGSKLIGTVAELAALGKPIINGMAQFYTGSLIHRSVVDRVGLPTPGFFTRGDEVEYVLRIQQAGFKTYTVIESRVTHPPEPWVSRRLLGNTYMAPIMPPWKQYYALRNDLINKRRFGFDRKSSSIRLLATYCGRCFLLQDRRFVRLIYTLWGFWDGMLNRLYVNSWIKMR